MSNNFVLLPVYVPGIFIVRKPLLYCGIAYRLIFYRVSMTRLYGMIIEKPEDEGLLNKK